MTREDVLKLFPEATDEQVTQLLNKSNSETAKGRKKLEELEAENGRLKEENGKLGELQAQIEEAENSKLTELEKLSKDLENSKQRVAELERIGAVRDQRLAAAEKFKITSEQASKVVKDDGTFDMELLGQIISDKESAAALAKEQEIANASGNPLGQSSSGGDNGNSIAEEMALSAAKRAGMANQDILNHYRRK